jgi:hypothetical protein
MELSKEERRVLDECRPALKRDGRAYQFHRAPKSLTWSVNGRSVCRLEAVAGPLVHHLVEAGLLQWVNTCRSAAVLTEEGKRARDAWSELASISTSRSVTMARQSG